MNLLKLIYMSGHLKKKKADTKYNAGGHIHIGINVLGNDIIAWKCFLKLYMLYENVLFRFAYGDKVSARKNILIFAPPVADYIYKKMSKINEVGTIEYLSEFLPIGKNTAINFFHIDFDDIDFYSDTLEFRIPNATTNEIIWQNNINTFAKMLFSSSCKVINEDFLNYKLKNEYIPYKGNEYRYNEVCLKNALEFVDLVFDNNLDKVYFLRQYLKSFQENYGFKVAVNAKRFIR